MTTPRAGTGGGYGEGARCPSLTPGAIMSESICRIAVSLFGAQGVSPAADLALFSFSEAGAREVLALMDLAQARQSVRRDAEGVVLEEPSVRFYVVEESTDPDCSLRGALELAPLTFTGDSPGDEVAVADRRLVVTPAHARCEAVEVGSGAHVLTARLSRALIEGVLGELAPGAAAALACSNCGGAGRHPTVAEIGVLGEASGEHEGTAGVPAELPREREGLRAFRSRMEARSRTISAEWHQVAYGPRGQALSPDERSAEMARLVAETRALREAVRAAFRAIAARLPFPTEVLGADRPEEGAGAQGIHIVVQQELHRGRFRRSAGDALCRPRKRFWGLSAGFSARHGDPCITCAERAERLLAVERDRSRESLSGTS